MTEAIRVENLSKVFINKKAPIEQREVWALQDISFNVNDGEIFGLLGPNGAGKTTTIRCIAGILKPVRGAVYIFGEDINKQFNFGEDINKQFNSHLLRKKLGFLTENHGSYENLSIYENLKFFGSFYDIKDIDSRIDTVLEEMDLLKRKNMKVGKLSKGQKQRLAIARAILHNPLIIFFDEPTSGLDPVAALRVRELILGLKSEDRTIFINSHNLEEVEKVCDRVAILDLGKIKRIGTPTELSRDLWNTQEMVFTLKNPISTQIHEKLTQLDYIKSFRIKENQIFVYSEDINETTPNINKEIVYLGGQILEIKRTIHSLEDSYLKLMDEINKGGEQ